jgi:uncharacterized membrane protein
MIKISNAIVAVIVAMLVTSFIDLFGGVFRLTEYGIAGGLLGIAILFMLREKKEAADAKGVETSQIKSGA